MFAEKHSRILACFELALFTFVFLDGEFVFDTVMGYLVNAHDVVAAESTVLAASAVGFLMLPLAQRLVRGRSPQARAAETPRVEKPAAGAPETEVRKTSAPRAKSPKIDLPETGTARERAPKGAAKTTTALIVLSVAAIATYAPIVWAPAAAGFGTPLPANAPATLALGCAAFALLGLMGAEAHLHAAHAFAGNTRTARAVGLSYAAGLLVQFAFNSLLENACAEAAALCLALCALTVCLGVSAKARRSEEVERTAAPVKTAHPVPTGVGEGEAEGLTNGESTSGRQKRSLVGRPTQVSPASGAQRAGSPRERMLLLAAVALMACVFCTLNNAVTLAHAQGTISVEAPPRLLLAASGVLAGFAFDTHGRRHMPLTMLCVTMLSVLSLLAMLAGFSNLVGLSVFYLASGFFVVFFTTSFLDAAAESPHPALWAGMGRAANNLCAGVIALPSLYLVQSGNVMATATFACVMFVATTVVVYNLVVPQVLAEARATEEKKAAQARAMQAAQTARGERDSETPPTASTIARRERFEDAQYPDEGLSEADSKAIGAAGAGEDAKVASHEQRLARFCKRYQLTPRESEVLERVCSDERTLREISEEMGISQRMLQRHLTSIYRKTGVQTRAGLTSMLLKGN